jgi:hypothetical protein
VKLSHTAARTGAAFDDPHLVSHAGLVPVMALADRAGLHDLAAEHVRPGGGCGANPELKVGCLVAGMAAGADPVDDMGMLGHGAMAALFAGIRAPSTLGSFLRSFTWGNVRQADRAGREFLTRLARQAPLLPGADVLAFADTGSTQKRVYGHKKQGARFGHTKIQGRSLLVRGLNALAATVSTPLAAPVIAGARLRGGNAGSARGAAGFASEAVAAARACGAAGTIVVRMDSAYCGAETIAAVRRAGARFSVTIPVTARLIVRRVRDLNPQAAAGQGELFPAWRYHAVFTDSPYELLQAEEPHRGHAVTGQVFADLNDGPLAHLPSGHFNANAAWLVIAAMAFNLVRAAGALASRALAKARAATVRTALIAVAARAARHGRGHVTLHLPSGWHREREWRNLFEAACGPPAAAA